METLPIKVYDSEIELSIDGTVKSVLIELSGLSVKKTKDGKLIVRLKNGKELSKEEFLACFELRFKKSIPSRYVHYVKSASFESHETLPCIIDGPSMGKRVYWADASTDIFFENINTFGSIILLALFDKRNEENVKGYGYIGIDPLAFDISNIECITYYGES